MKNGTDNMDSIKNQEQHPAILNQENQQDDVHMTKKCKRLKVIDLQLLGAGYVLLKLTDNEPLPLILAGQFVEVKVDDSPSTFLRRPISIHFVDRERNELWLLVKMVGEGTRKLGMLSKGATLDLLFPLGNGFSKGKTGEIVLLIGGGVGIAPLLEYGKQLKESGATPVFLLGGRTAADVVEQELYARYGDVYVTTEDGSMGEKGFVTDSHLLILMDKGDNLGNCPDIRIACCGPKPMMVAVARWARQHDVKCEMSLENMMACGLGACLCCVEKTVKGNVCVCKEGPVFDINELTWQI